MNYTNLALSTMKKPAILIFAFSLFLGCIREGQVPNFDDQIDYEVKATVYWGDPSDGEIDFINYYDKNDHLIEKVGKESRVKYIYNEAGILVERFFCREFNCEIGWRSINVFDSSGNQIGIYRTRDSVVNLDTVKVIQSKFYNSENQLTKVLFDQGTDFYGKYFENWKYYFYNGGHISESIEMRNSDTVWASNYTYDKNGNVILIDHRNGEKSKKETYCYDKANRIIQYSLKSNEYPIPEDCSYTTTEFSTTYRYNGEGKLIEEINFNHKGEIYTRFVYVYEKKE